MNANEWREECNYISRLADKAGMVPEMNHDIGAAIRYCEMQQAAAEREGFRDAATYIGECLDDMRRAQWLADKGGPENLTRAAQSLAQSAD